MNAAGIAATQAPVQMPQLEGMPVDGAAVGSDVFAALLQQMLGGAVEDQGMGQLFAMTQQADEDAAQNGGQLAAELFAGNLMANPQQVEQLLAQVQAQPQALNAAVVQHAGTVLLPTPETQPRQQREGPLPQFQPMTAQAVPAGESLLEGTAVVQLEAADGQGTGDTRQGEMQFFNSIAEAKKQLQAQEGKPKDSTSPQRLDIDQLQHEVDAGKYSTTVEIQRAAARELDAQSVLSQLKTGVKQNLSLGKDEFVVKLKPEGLGEITVKVMEANSKISLSIITSSAQVAKLLSGGITELREALRAYNAEVQDVVDQHQYDSMQQGGYHQSFAGNQHHQQTPGRNHTLSYAFDSAVEEQLLAEELPVGLTSELDTYI